MLRTTLASLGIKLHLRKRQRKTCWQLEHGFSSEISAPKKQKWPCFASLFCFGGALTKKMPIIFPSFYQAQNSCAGIYTQYRGTFAMKQNRIRHPWGRCSRVLWSWYSILCSIHNALRNVALSKKHRRWNNTVWSSLWRLIFSPRCVAHRSPRLRCGWRFLLK